MDSTTLKKIIIIKAVIIALIVLIATALAKTLMFDFLVDYKQFVRFSSFVAFGWLAFKYYKFNAKTEAIISGLCMLLFNPFQHIDAWNMSFWNSFYQIAALFIFIWIVVEYRQLKQLKMREQ